MSQIIKRFSILAALSFLFLLSSNTIVHAENTIKNDDYFKELKVEYIKDEKSIEELKRMSLTLLAKENLSEEEKKEVLMYEELIDELKRKDDISINILLFSLSLLFVAMLLLMLVIPTRFRIY